MGAELNAATSRENTVVFARVPDHHVETALDVMADMVFAPAFAEVDSGARGSARGDRDVRGHAAGARPRPLLTGGLRRPSARPAGDRHGGGHLHRQPPRARGLPPHRVCAGQCRRRRGGEPRARPPRRTAAAERAPCRRPRARRYTRPSTAYASAGARAPLPAEGHRAVPRLPRRDRHLTLRSPSFRCVAIRLDPRRLGVVAALPGDPREARHGLLRVQLRGAVHRHGCHRRLRRHARGEPRLVRRDHRRADRRDRCRAAAQGRARAREGEPQGPHRPRARVDLEPDEPTREVARHRHGAHDARARHGRDRCCRSGRARRARRGAVAVGAARRFGRRAGRGQVPRRGRACGHRAVSKSAAA